MLTSIIFFTALFFVICGLVLVSITFVNIFTKSYKPKNALYILGLIIILFLINGIFSTLSFGNLLNSLEEGINQNSNPSTTSDFIY